MSVADQATARRPQLAVRLAWPACGLTLALLAAGLLIPADLPVGMTGVAPLAMWAAASAVVGAVVAARRSENPIGWLLSAGGLLVGFGLFAGQYAYYTLVTRPGSLPGGQAMLWLAGWPFDAGLFLVLFLLLLFPTGRLPSPDGDRSCDPPSPSTSPPWSGVPSGPARSARTSSVRSATPWGSRRPPT